MGRKLVSLNFKPSTALPELDELKTFLTTEFGAQVPGFTVLETDAKWGDLTLDLVGKDAEGRLIAVFPAVTQQERDFHEVIAHALVASAWLEDNNAEVARLYADRGVDARQPLRMILVSPSLARTSRALTRAFERAGVEVMSYAIYELDTGNGQVLAVSFATPSASAGPATESPAAATPRAPAPSAPAPAGRAEKPRETERPRPEPTPAPPVESRPEPPRTEASRVEPPRAEPARVEAPPEPPKPKSAVETFIASLPDPTIKTMSEQILTFLTSRFPTAEGVVSPQERGFTLTVGAEHLATIRLDRGALWLEVGPERIPTNRIKDPATLERAMTLPSVLEALGSVHGR